MAPSAKRATAGPRRRLRGADRRERILDAAAEVFADRGYATASMAQIAARAGVVASVIYDHFGSKRELALTLLEAHGEAIVEKTITEVEPASPAEMMRVALELFFAFVEEDEFVWRFLFRDPPPDPEIAAVHRRIHDRATEGIAVLVLMSAPAGVMPELPRELAATMVARASQEACQGLARWWFENREVPREQVVEVAYGLLWEGARGLIERSSEAG